MEIPSLFRKIHRLQDQYGILTMSPSLSRQMLRSYNIELEYHRNNHDVQAGIELIETIATFLGKNRALVPKDYYVMFYYQFAFFYFLAGQYRNAISWLGQIQKLPPARARLDIQAQARLLSLMLYYQTKQISVLRYSVDSARRFLKKHDLVSDSATILLRLFSRLSTNPQDRHLAIMRDADDHLSRLDEKPIEALEQSEQLRWLRGNIATLSKSDATRHKLAVSTSI